MLTEDQKKHIVEVFDAFCESHNPIWVRDKVVLQFRIHRHDVMLFEKRPLFNDPEKWIHSDVAKFRLNATAGAWSLLWQDRNARWHFYDNCEPSPEIERLLEEVDSDPTGIFWG